MQQLAVDAEQRLCLYGNRGRNTLKIFRILVKFALDILLCPCQGLILFRTLIHDPLFGPPVIVGVVFYLSEAGGSVELRSKKALIEGFVAQMTVKTDVEKDWKDFVKKQKEQDLETIIKDEKLKHAEAQKFIEMFS